MKKALFLARAHTQAHTHAHTHTHTHTGPVLIDVPKDIQQQLAVPDWNTPMSITSYISRLPPPPKVWMPVGT